MILVEPHGGILDEEALDIGRIVVGASAKAGLNRTEVNASAAGGIALVGAVVVVAVKLPEVIGRVHVVVDDVEKHS
jgi:hypothetical protein